MSKNVKILQDGQEKTLNKVSKIQTQLANGLTCNWIPEDEVPLGELTVSSDGVYNPAQDPNGPYYGYSKVTVSGVGTTVMGQLAEITITKNGTYSASADKDGPFYGYSKVIVNVKSSDDGGGGSSSRPVVPGKDSDGDDAVVTTDDDGNIVTEKLPSEIKVIVTPDNLEYEDGQSIVFDGLLVKAYYPDGTEYDSIPTTDLIRPVRVAENNNESGTGDWTEATSEDVSESVQPPQPIRYSSSVTLRRETIQNDEVISWEEIIYEAPYVTAWNTNNNGGYIVLCASSSAFEVLKKTRRWSKSTGDTESVTRNNINSGSTYNDKPISYQSTTGTGSYTFSIDAGRGAPYGTIYLYPVSYIMIYGNSQSSSSDFQQIIPLQWERPGDKKVLETSFTITVHASDDSGSGSGGSSSDPQPQPTPQPG